jgi:hypothetical protein
MDIIEISQDSPPPTSFGTVITRLAFKVRFSDTERKAIRAAAQADADVADAWDLADSASYIDLARDDVKNLTLLLVSKGLLTMPRRAAILAIPVTDERELPGSVRVAFGLAEVP